MLEGNYNHLEVEQKWQKQWFSSNLYHWDIDLPKSESYIIDTPPPTVSGLLHLGHTFSYSQADFIARYKRMTGLNVFYPIGFDDNGLATERLVEKIKGVKAAEMHREDFRKICQQVVEESEEEFRELFKAIALSVDWRQEYQTVSDKTIKISQMSFIDLLNKGHAERRLAPTTWDTVDQTAIAQAEIEDKEKQGVMNNIAFTISSGGSEKIIIATTRPELLAACVAVFYHPDDSRYRHLKSQFATTPIFNARVPIIADEDVAIDKGTGLVMCCTFGDIQDIAWWRRHQLPIKKVITQYGKMTNSGSYDGLSIKEARAKIIHDLKASSQLELETLITQFVKCAERSGAPLEIIVTNQWYIKLLNFKDQLIEKGRQCSWNPDYMRIRYENWVNGLNQDWCISRQRYFGVPFPVWYSKRQGEEGKVLIATIDQLPCDPTRTLPVGYSVDEVEPERDVMDTWATSGLTPQINSQGLSDELAVDHTRHKKLYPADLRPQAHEIIRTWSFYTIAKSLLHANSIPWKDLMISGWCLAADKTKMSKSKGNVVTPKALIVEKGADAVRYWASNSKLGADIIYSDDIFKNGSRLIMKLWNASKFLSIHLAAIDGMPMTVLDDVGKSIIFEDVDKWILAKLYQVVKSATEHLESYNYSDARATIEEFFWRDLCDNYLELIKVRLYKDEPQNHSSRQSAIYTLYHVLRTIYHLFAPFIPHITEELNSLMFGRFNAISVHAKGSWPKLANYHYAPNDIENDQPLIHYLEMIRKYKSINNLSLRTELTQVIYSGPSELSPSLLKDLANAANTKQMIFQAELNDYTLTSGDGGLFKIKI